MPSNITLYNKPLLVIQTYLQGKWELQYTTGSIAGGTYYDKYHSYMIIQSGHITIGNDSLGVITETSIDWQKVKLRGENGYTYLLNYHNPFPKFVNKIYNDTLVLSDYQIADGYQYFYTRWNH